jgi:hypothetical protein
VFASHINVPSRKNVNNRFEALPEIVIITYSIEIIILLKKSYLVFLVKGWKFVGII